MPVTTSELLQFILDLLADPTKADAFSADPNGALAAAGLADVSCADVDAIAPLIANSAPGAVAIAGVGGGGAEPTEMIHHLVKNVAVSSFDNSGVIQNIWGAGEVRQAFASDGGFALGGSLFTDDPVVVGDGNLIASDSAHAAGRDIIQNQADGNLALGGDQTIAQDAGVIAGGDAIAEGDKVGGNNNQAGNTGNDNSVTVGGNQNNAGNTGNDNSVSVGGNQNNAQNTGNTQLNDNSVTVGGNQNNADNTGNSTIHDESVTIGDIAVDLSQDHSTTIGDIAVDLSDHSDHSTTIGDIAVDLSNDNSIGGNQNNAENTGNVVGGNQNNAQNTGNDNSDNSDNSLNVGDVDVVLGDSVGGDNWESGSNAGGIGNTDNRNSNNTNDSGNTVVMTETNDDSINVGTVAVDLSNNSDNSDNTNNSTVVGGNQNNAGNTGNDNSTNTEIGDIEVDLSEDNSVGDITNVEVSADDNSVDNSLDVGGVEVEYSPEYSSTEVNDFTYTEANDYTYTEANDYTYAPDNSSTYGDYAGDGSGDTANVAIVENDTTLGTTDYNFEYGG